MKLVMTGGHHSSALPVLDYIEENNLDIDVVWFGHKYSMKGNKNTTLEYREVTSRGVPFIELHAGKFYRTKNLFRLAKIPWGFIQAFYYLLKFKPDVVLSFGGYLSVPVVFDSWLLGIPSITHEQTVVTGYANNFISRFVDKILISHEESKEYFPKEKIVFSGLPLRKSLYESKTDSFKFDNNLPVVYITAGKTGSHKINTTIKSCLPRILEKYNVIHQTGDHSIYDDYDELQDLYESISLDSPGKYYIRKFVLEDEIGEVFHKADIFISRAGAHTTYEIKEFDKPAVLIPIPWVSHNEQYKNAELLVKEGLGVILSEEDLACDTLLQKLSEICSRVSNSENFLTNYNVKPVEIIVDQINKLHDKKNSTR